MPGRPPRALTETATDPALLAQWRDRAGAAVAWPELLGALRRRARPVHRSLSGARRAFGWDSDDTRTREWMPQGVTSSADAGPSGVGAGHHLLLVSWYAPRVDGHTRGVRVSVVDLDAEHGPRYTHVRLVEPSWSGSSAVSLPVDAHAGGIAWCADRLLVADTYRGLRAFDVRDLVRSRDGTPHLLLPQCAAYVPVDPAPAGAGAAMRFSFVSVDRTGDPHALVAGEYAPRTGRPDTGPPDSGPPDSGPPDSGPPDTGPPDSGPPDSGPTRIVRYALEPTGRPRAVEGTVLPLLTLDIGISRMQGAACVDGTYIVTASNGRHGRGDLWIGDPVTGLHRRRCALPAGPEDLASDPASGCVWTLTEWPGRRVVLALPGPGGVSRAPRRGSTSARSRRPRSYG